MKAKLTPAQIAIACADARAGYTLRTIGARYDVSHETIRRALRQAGLRPAGSHQQHRRWEETT